MTLRRLLLIALLATPTVTSLAGCQSADPGYTPLDAAPKDASNKIDGGAPDASALPDQASSPPADSAVRTD
jgi:hypothetical protein